ncbi:MAG: ABC transporter permease [Lentisphaerae bacterium]|nr:ABC transporter permease [Lentisphaerota bacterium]
MAGKNPNQRQKLPPFNRICSIASSGMQVRLGRSLITMCGICLALAYLVSIRVSGLVTENIAHFSQAVRCYDYSGHFLGLEQAYHPELKITRAQVERWRAILLTRAANSVFGEVQAEATKRRQAAPSLAQLQEGAWQDGSFTDLAFLNTSGRHLRDAYLREQGLDALPEAAQARQLERLSMAERAQLIAAGGAAPTLAALQASAAAAFAERNEITARVIMGELEKTLDKDGLTANLRDISVVRQERAARYWIMGIVLVVAVAGIANATLMSVTERFREIGTMKCLGALDGMVLLLFLVEALVVGTVGVMTGLVLGCLLSLVQLGMQYGWAAAADIPWREIILALSQLGLVGIVLTVFGGVGPAHVAARMAPIEAMRVEQ